MPLLLLEDELALEMLQYNDSEKQDRGKTNSLIYYDSISSIGGLLTMTMVLAVWDWLASMDHTRYQIFRNSSGSTAMTDGHATWQVRATLVTTEMHNDVAKPIKNTRTISIFSWSEDAWKEIKKRSCMKSVSN